MRRLLKVASIIMTRHHGLRFERRRKCNKRHACGDREYSHHAPMLFCTALRNYKEFFGMENESTLKKRKAAADRDGAERSPCNTFLCTGLMSPPPSSVWRGGGERSHL